MMTKKEDAVIWVRERAATCEKSPAARPEQGGYCKEKKIAER
jgi:hypothetical protein